MDAANTTASFRQFHVDQIAADMKESICRVSDGPFDAQENVHVPTVSYEVPPVTSSSSCHSITSEIEQSRQAAADPGCVHHQMCMMYHMVKQCMRSGIVLFAAACRYFIVIGGHDLVDKD